MVPTVSPRPHKEIRENHAGFVENCIGCVTAPIIHTGAALAIVRDTKKDIAKPHPGVKQTNVSAISNAGCAW